MSNQIIFGNVNAIGTKFTGSDGFSVNRQSKGTYVISFNPDFTESPALVTSQNFPDWNGDGVSGNTKDNVVIHKLSNNQAILTTGDQDGNLIDRNFSFIAIGN